MVTIRKCSRYSSYIIRYSFSGDTEYLHLDSLNLDNRNVKNKRQNVYQAGQHAVLLHTILVQVHSLLTQCTSYNNCGVCSNPCPLLTLFCYMVDIYETFTKANFVMYQQQINSLILLKVSKDLIFLILRRSIKKFVKAQK